MDFFAAQDQAKKRTRTLVLVYILVLVVLTVLSTIVLLFLTPLFTGQAIPSPLIPWLLSPQNLPTLLAVGAFVMGGALISSYIKSRHLAKGGSVIAAALGGGKISPDSANANERKVLNVVEEMAIASGMPVPEVFLLKKEAAINAFAAGQTPIDAVIGVTQGAIDKLTRNQLQGVIGHEFSHILNGDMRLNLRLIMLLHGIEFISTLGRILTSSQRHRRYRSSRSNRKGGGGVIILAGIALRVIGWFGKLAGNLIQAAVSRQREFLADAASVQFTRDPSAIAGALKVIGGISETSRIKNAEVGEVAHLFFGQAFITRFSSLFATHPPISIRIRTLEPGWNGEYLEPVVHQINEVEREEPSQSKLEQALPEPLMLLLAAGVAVDALSKPKQDSLAKMVEEVNQTLNAMALLLALLIHNEKSTHKTQEPVTWQSVVGASDIKGLQALVRQYLIELKAIESVNLLPLIELSMPALKQMSSVQYHFYKKLLEEIILLDGKQSVFEQSIYQLVVRYLDVHFGLEKAHKVKFTKASQVAMEIQLLFSILAGYGHKNSLHSQSAHLAFKKAVQHLGLAHLALVEMPDIDESVFKQATEKLIYCSLPLKHKISEAMALCIQNDQQVLPIEKELALAIAATMDAPLPRVGL